MNLIFNEEIKKILRNCKINVDDGLSYLLCIYFNIRPTNIKSSLRIKVNATNIVVFNDKDKTYKWNMSLFENTEHGSFNWVEHEYVSLFEKTNPEKGGKVKEATVRMKKFFAENPQYRKDDVLAATKMYLNNENSRFIRFPHYFIKKGRGVNETSDLLDWLRKYEISQNQHVGRSSHNNTMKE